MTSPRSPWTIGVVTVSDRCHSGESVDKSGPAIVDFLAKNLDNEHGQPTFVTAVVPDEVADIQSEVKNLCLRGCELVVTTGGTGFSVRDVTPEAVRPLLTKEAPGVMHAMMAYGLQQTPVAWLSRAVAGVIERTVVLCLPGSSKAVVECLTPLCGKGLDHAMELASGNAGHAHPPTSSANMAARRDGAADAEPACRAAPSGDATPGDGLGGGGADVTSRDRESGFAMVSMADALRLIAEHTPEPTHSRVATPAALGHVVAKNVTASFNLPPFRASIKDGYAVIAADGPGEYDVVGSLCAGETLAAGFVLQRGQIVRVNTGGPIPDGADAVVQVEDTELVATKPGPNGRQEEARVRITSTVTPGHDVRPIGCDMQPGGVALNAGDVMNAPEVGLAMSVGASHVTVCTAPRVAVLSTGDELAEVPPTDGDLPAPPAGQIYDSNRGMLIAAAKKAECSVVDCGIASDTMESTRRKLEQAFAAADVVLSTGGVSMGEVDCVKRCLIEMGATVHFGRVSMKPGKPTTFATLNGKVFFALPGNPVSAMVCFHVFATPALRKMQGHRCQTLPTVQAKVTHDVRLDKQRPEYHRCHLSYDMVVGGFVCRSTGVQASHRLLSLAGANGLMVLPTGTDAQPSIAKHSVVDVMVIGELTN